MSSLPRKSSPDESVAPEHDPSVREAQEGFLSSGSAEEAPDRPASLHPIAWVAVLLWLGAFVLMLGYELFGLVRGLFR